MTHSSHDRPRPTSFQNLEVYQQAYQASVVVITKLLPVLPEEERYDLKVQLRRSCKTIPRLIAEGYAKRYQARGFQKYLDDASGECNEMVVSVSHARDRYGTPAYQPVCDQLIDLYDKLARQLFKLAAVWGTFSQRRRQTPPPNETHPLTATAQRQPSSRQPTADTGNVTDHRTT